jgi:hypothetical protein
MIRYKNVLGYLDTLADASGNIDNSPHGRWWKKPAVDGQGDPIAGKLVDLTYQEFKVGTVKGRGIPTPIPIVDQADPSNSSFYQILVGPYKFGNKAYRQMPDGGPLITDPTNDPYTLPDGTTITGAQIQQNLLEWLKGGYPE